MKSAFLYSEFFSHYDFGALHPFKTTRAQIVYELCHRYHLLDSPWIEVIKPEPLPFEQLTLFHDSEYLVLLQAASSKAFAFEMLGCGLGTEENPVIEGLYTLISLSAGATYRGAELLALEDFTLAFNVFGGFHHAGKAHAEGFCYINDVGIALSYLVERGLKVACIDLDAQSGKTLYPWSGFETEIGEGAGTGYNINIPLLQGTDDETYLYAFSEIVPPVMEAFSPDITIGVFGADTHHTDPLTHLNMSNHSLCRAVNIIAELSPKVLALGAGGYNVYNSARTWSLIWATLNKLEPEDAFMGAVGGMMYGPEAESGSLEEDSLILTSGTTKDTTHKEVVRVVDSIKGTVFPLWGI
jgi:acetoin utilization protein AcuC